MMGDLIFRFGQLILCASILAACGMSRPGIDDGKYGAVGFDHVVLKSEQRCDICHEAKRPTRYWDSDSRQFKSGHYQTSKNNGDCFTCHTNLATNGGADNQEKMAWKFGHKNALSQQMGLCLPCHMESGQRAHYNAQGYFSPSERCVLCHRNFQYWERTTQPTSN